VPVPVPVMFTLHGWDPGKRDIEKWLAARLQRTYPALFPGKGGARKAASLLTHNKVTVILDGLDEIAEKLRPAALRALSAQAEFRVVLICRSEEMVAAVQEGMLDAAVAVELQPVGPKDAAQYLTDVQRYPPPTGWAELTRRLDEGSDSALAQALCSPLALTLVRDTYRSSDNVHELIDISNDAGSEASMQRIEEYLLDRVLPAAYEPDEGKPKPRYAQQAESAFHYIASKMSENKTTDLQWWLIPDWAAYGPRVLMTGVAAGLVTVLWVAIAFVFLGAPIIVGLFLGVVGGIVAAVYFGRNVEDNWEWAVGPPPGILPFSGGGIRELAHWFDESSNVKTNPLTPKASWRSSFIKAIVSAPFIALFCGLVVGGVLWALEDNPFKVSLVEGWALFGLIVGVAAIPAFALTATPTWPASLAFIELRFSQHTPIRLMRFLEDARQRGVLRMVGPVYQFRHAHLQDRLAEQASPPALSHDASEASAV
jgi:hypothetical protein